MENRLLAASGILLVLAALSFVLADPLMYALAKASGAALSVWQSITFLGDSGWMVVLALALVLGGAVVRGGSRLRASGWMMLAAVAIPGLTSSLVKNSIGRARPYLFETEGAYSFSPFLFNSTYASLPSGHTTTAFAMATFVALRFPQTAPVAFALAVVAGYSRMAVGAHYLSDVLAGAALGTTGAVLVWRWLRSRINL